MTFTITKPGIYFDVPVDAYFNDPTPVPSLTQSIAKILIEKSPAHAAAAHPRLNPLATEEDAEPEKYIASQAIGNAAHSLLIGRGKEIAVAEFDNWQTKIAKEFKAEKLAAGLTPILAKHFARAEAMVLAAQRQLDAVGWYGEGKGEVVIAWQEGETWLRSLIDWLGDDGNVYDYKTTGLSCAPHAVPMMMANAGWDIQAAMIERGLDVLQPELAGRRKSRFIAQENEPPFALTPVELTEGVLTMGRKKLAYAVEAWRRSMASGVWPAYPSEVCRPDFPPWKETQWLNREIEEADRKPRQLASLMGG